MLCVCSAVCRNKKKTFSSIKNKLAGKKVGKRGRNRTYESGKTAAFITRQGVFWDKAKMASFLDYKEPYLQIRFKAVP